MPLISWTQSAIQNVTYSGGDKRLELMTDLGTLIGTLTHWSIETTDLAATGGAYVLKPDAGSAYPNQRIIIFADSVGVVADRATKFARPYTGVNQAETQAVCVGYCRDIGAGTYTTWDSINPFGLVDATQWWLYQVASDEPFSGVRQIDHMYAIESADGLAFFFNRTATASWWGMVAGYLMEDIDDIPFSMCLTSGPTIISPSFWNSTNAFADGSGTSKANASLQVWKCAPVDHGWRYSRSPASLLPFCDCTSKLRR